LGAQSRLIDLIDELIKEKRLDPHNGARNKAKRSQFDFLFLTSTSFFAPRRINGVGLIKLSGEAFHDLFA
jgi:hypothetical protein